MNILAIDSSAAVASVVLQKDDTVLGEYFLDNGNTHSETILPMTESLLGRLSLTAKDIDLFAVSIGPGSFTGLRIGVATIKGLAFGSQKPCVGVSTLESLAYNLEGFSGILCPVMDARRNQVFTALFRSDGKAIKRISPDRAMDFSELDQLLSAYDEPIYLIGDGYKLAKETLTVKTMDTPERLIPQCARSIAKIAKREYECGTAVDESALAPVYLRLSKAERERLEKEALKG
ncbi:MAG: tRNA (adenosine(37)-N6)-threonylcarbamoyltransferase complex dimerization subunit type 1 TsaB [Clostridia bacterium]|nr:tRNA (adenosine(37)-N6)-threonylcarbamoyltransferase complex dimerization subunit type 1 TsaB [Clostridia bacterium]